MYCTKKVTDAISWIGGNDRRISLFENVYPVPARPRPCRHRIWNVSSAW